MIHIVGAGFSGLMTAYYLVKSGHKVRVLEKSASSGGLIQTRHNNYGLVETAANGFLDCEELQNVSRDIGVPLISTQKESRHRYIYLKTPRRWPLSLSQSLKSIPRLLRFGLLRPSSMQPQSLETLEDYGKRVFGSEVTYQLLEPALRGIYAGQIRRMSASLIFAKYFKPRNQKMRSTVAPEKGMQSWIKGLEQWLHKHGVKIEYNHAVKPEALTHGLWILATSASASARLLESSSRRSSELLKQVEMLPVMTVTLFFSQREKLKGFGVLFPETEKFQSLGVLFNHDIFAGRSDFQSETWILGGAHNKSIMNQTDEQILDLIQQDRKRIFSGENKLMHHTITRWPEALPHYTVELENLLPQLELPSNVHLVGNYLGGIGLSQILFQAKYEAARWSV